MEKATKKWLDRFIPSLKGKNILLTGGTSGIGYEAALALVYKGAHVLIACRSRQKALLTQQKIISFIPNAEVSFYFYDQSSISSIQALAKTLAYVSLNAVLLNAGVMFPPKNAEYAEPTPLTIRTNMVGPYCLYSFLVEKHPSSRYVFVNSIVNRRPEDGDYGHYLASNQYSRNHLYAVSKRSMMSLFYLAMENQSTVYLMHPGVTKTNIIRSYAPMIKKIGNGFLYLFSHKPEKACLGLVLAASGVYPSGTYFVPRGIFHISGYPKAISAPIKKCQQDALSLKKSLDDDIRNVAP